MGSASSVVQTELSKPIDSSDLKSEEEARAEVTRLRKLLHSNAKGENIENIPERKTANRRSINPQAIKTPPNNISGVKSPTAVNFARFEKNAENFRIEEAPTLNDYLVNEFHRYCGKDEVLEWDEFWRFMKGLELGLTDLEIGQLRQKADVNKDGVVDWHELLAVLEPLLGKVWAAKNANAPEYDKFIQLHWETHHKVQKTKDGFTKKGDPFWVNKISGETCWTKPNVLERHPSLEEKKAERNVTAAPNLTQFLTQAFEKESENGRPLTYAQLWKVVKDHLLIDPPITPKEMELLMKSADFSGDGKLDLQEFLHALSPHFEKMFEKREAGGDWVTLTHVHEDGHEYLYWYNRVTHKSSWENPNQKPSGDKSHKRFSQVKPS